MKWHLVLPLSGFPACLPHVADGFSLPGASVSDHVSQRRAPTKHHSYARRCWPCQVASPVPKAGTPRSWAALCGSLALLRLSAQHRPVSRRAEQRESTAERTAEDLAPFKEFQMLKADPLCSWGFLSEQDLLLRFAGVFGIVFTFGIFLTTSIFPPTSLEGTLILRNVLADVLYSGCGALVFVLLITIAIARRWDMVNKGLARGAYVIEYDPTKQMNYDSGSGGAYAYKKTKSKKDQERDKLLADYETEPVVSRLRVYLLQSFGASVVCLISGIAAGGETRLAVDEEEEELVGGSPLIYDPKRNKKKCGSGCIPGLD